MNVLLIASNANRDVPILERIKLSLERQNPNNQVLIIERFSCPFEITVLKFRPDIILTYPMTSKGLSHAYYILKYILKCKIFCFRTEGAFGDKALGWKDFHVGFDKYDDKLVDCEIFWGKKMANYVGNQLIKQGKLSSAKRIKVTGYPALEGLSELKKSPPKLPPNLNNKINKFSQKKLLLVVTGFYFSDYSIEDILNAKDLNPESNLADLLVSVKNAKLFKQECIDSIKKAALENPDYLIIVKKHPMEKESDYLDFEQIENVLYVPEALPVDSLLFYVSALFHYGSTCLVNAILQKKHTIFFYNDVSGHHLGYSDMGWPSSEKLHISKLSQWIKDNNDEKSITPNYGEIDDFLYENFNLNLSTPYHPSKKIADILISKSISQQPISFLSKCFLKSVATSILAPHRLFLLCKYLVKSVFFNPIKS